MENEKLKIKINNFYSLKKVEFEIEKGINLIVGRNGSGKSQLLLSIANQYGGFKFIHDYGFDNNKVSKECVTLTPSICRLLWRPPVRKLAESSFRREYAMSGSTEHYISIKYNKGYTNSIDGRFSYIYDRLANIYIAFLDASQKNEISNEKITWVWIKENFKLLFNKELKVLCNNKGIMIGIRLDEDSMSSFNTLSTGELEFISLALDLLTESEVDLFLIDEIDVHFHPDLQKQVIQVISDLVKDKYVLISTHSPALMLSVDSERIFYISSWMDVKDGENQIKKLTSDYSLLESVSSLYQGFSTDIRVSKLFQDAFFHTTLKFADECQVDSQPLSGSEKDSDPQITSLRSQILSLSGAINVLEIGIGKGRTLNSIFNITSDSNLKINYYGVDLNEDFLSETKEYFSKHTSSIINNLVLEKSLDDLGLEEKSTDICIFANVVHEIDPRELSSIVNKAFSFLKKGGKLIILEQIVQEVGEKNFLMFESKALLKVFETQKKQDHVCANFATPKSYSGKNLLEFIVIKNTEESVSITDEDVLSGIDKIIEDCIMKIQHHIEEKEVLSSLELAFFSHNLSNALAYCTLMKSDKAKEKDES